MTQLNAQTKPSGRLSVGKRIAFAAVVVVAALLVPAAALIGIDVYLHGKYATTGGFNVWGYRGPVAGRKRAGEYRVAFLGGSTVFGYGVKWTEAIPAMLEDRLQKSGVRPFSVVNLGYNNEGAYSMRFTLQDYAYLDYDLVCLYEGYNDVNGDNFSVFRHDSPVFRLTSYLPIFPIVLREKAAALLHGGDIGALYRHEGKTVFRASIAQRAAAGVLDATAAVGESLERRLDPVTARPSRRLAADLATGCAEPSQHYCEAMFVAVDYALRAGKQVIVITQPYGTGVVPAARHRIQQRELAAMIARKFGASGRVKYVNLGDGVNLDDPLLSFDHMHLTAEGNRRIGTALVEPVLEMAATRRQ